MKDQLLLENGNMHALALAMLNDYVARLQKRTYMTMQEGIKKLPIKFWTPAVYYTKNKLVFAVDENENKYFCQKTMRQLASELDPRQFFRVNRQTIVNIDAIASFKVYERVKLEVKLHLAHICHTVIVSQQKAGKFKKWIAEA